MKQGEEKPETESGLVRITSGQQIGIVYWREVVLEMKLTEVF